jgi:hypothetical protein
VENSQTEKTKSLISDLETMRRRLVLADAIWEQDDKRHKVEQAANFGGPHDQDLK